MKLRLLFGPVLIIALLALMWLDQSLVGTRLPSWLGFLCDPKTPGLAGGGIVLLFIGLVAAARGGYELAIIFRTLSIEASPKSLSFCAAAGLFAGAITIGNRPQLIEGVDHGTLLATGASLAVFLSMLAYIRHRDPKGAATAVAAAGFSFLYIGLPLAFLLAIHREQSVWAMLAIIFTIKACDSGAYFTGTAIGKHKLIPWLSPGKTWEGLLGGLITSGAFGVGFVALNQAYGNRFTITPLSLVDGAALGVILGVLGQAGDLSASVLKRDAGVKDASKILPGFGGLIDMLDSLLIAPPVAYWFFVLR